ncbi:MAG: winged helix DNA-binding domain-containing protein [Actinomycetota bacterium]|nr:winged helix DNA-binding domain-containing protein [Actinomycetota bacterium]
MRPEVTREQAVRFRVLAHGLRERSSKDSLERCAGLTGLHDSPEGSALLALGARLQDLDLETYRRALLEDKRLVRVWGVRGAPYVVPTRDAHIFTNGALPQDDESLASLLTGDMLRLQDAGMPAREAFDMAVEAVDAVLDRPMRKGELSEALHGRLPQQLEPWCDGCQVKHIPDGLLRIVGLTGKIVFGPRVEGSPALVRARDWLGRDFRGEDTTEARKALTRRFLRGYGPTTHSHFATWTNLSVTDTRRTWEGLQDEMVPVGLDGRRCWVLKEEQGTLHDAPQARGVRFLPPNDPFLAQRDRAVLIPERELRPKVWKPLGNPGVLLIDGEPVGIWRAKAKPLRLEITVESWSPIPASRRAELEQEVATVANLRGRAEVVLTQK